MKKLLYAFSLIAGLASFSTGCHPASSSQLQGEADPSTLCGSSSQCLLYTQQSNMATTGLYWVQPGNHVHRLASCDLAGAQKLSGIKSAAIQVAQSDIDDTDVGSNPLIACRDSSGHSELDSRFSLDATVYRVQFADYFFVNFNDRLYFKVNITACPRVLEAWAVDSNRMIETLETEPEDFPIREFHCSVKGGDKPPEPGIDRNRLGWHVYQVNGYLDLTPAGSQDPIQAYWLEYVWPDQTRSPLIVSKVRKQGQTQDLTSMNSTDAQDFADALLRNLQAPLDAVFSYPDDLFSSDNFRALASDFVFSPVVTFNRDSERLESFPDLAPNQLAAASAVTPEDASSPLLTEYFKLLKLSSGTTAPLQWQKLLFANGKEAKSVTAVLTDEEPLSANPDLPAPPRSKKVQYIFESCPNQQMESILGPGVTDAASSNQTIYTLRDSVRRLYTKLQSSRVDQVYKYPCLVRQVCEVSIQNATELRAAAIGEGAVARCAADTDTLVLRLQQNLILLDDSNRTGLEFRRDNAGLQSKLPLLKQLKLVSDKPITIANRCLSCLRTAANGCSLDGTAAIPMLNFSGFERVTLRNIDLRLNPPTGAQFAYPQAGLEMETGTLELDHVTITAAANGQTLGSYAPFRKALCAYNTTLFAHQSSIDGDQFSVQSYRSRILLNGSSVMKSNRNLPAFVDDLAYFPAEEKDQNRMIVRNGKSDGFAIKAVDSTIFGMNASIEAQNIGIELSGERGESNVNGFGWEFFGPMVKGSDRVYDPALAGGASKGIQFVGSSKAISQMSFGRFVGFMNFGYFPYGEKVAGANRLYIYDSIGTNPRLTNANLSNITQTFRNGELVCQGNCEKPN